MTTPVTGRATTNAFETYLNQHGEEAWAATLTTLLRSIHEVDKNATQIWFSFYPLSLHMVLREAPNREELARDLLLQGDYDLTNQIDSSHRFLYGHRYWPHVKKAVESFSENFNAGEAKLADNILQVAGQAAQAAQTDPSLTTGITAVAFMTLQQVGIDAFKSAKGEVLIDKKHVKRSPEQVLSERAKDDSQSLYFPLPSFSS